MRLQLIQNEQFKIRTVRRNGETLFVGRDAAQILGYKNPRLAVIDHVDEDDRFLERIDTQKGVRKAVVINEIGVYSLILSSSLPAAKDFKRWLCGEVIPSLRKNGAYLTDATLSRVSASEDELRQLTANLEEERQKHIATLKLLGERETSLQERDALIERKNAYFARNKPRIDFAKAVFENRTAILVGEMAKLLAQNGVDIGQNRLFEWLRENGYLQRKQGNMWNMPYQKCVDAGLFIIKESVATARDGREYIARTPMVTGKGQRYFISKFLETRDEEALAAIEEEELRLAAQEDENENVNQKTNTKAQNKTQNVKAKTQGVMAQVNVEEEENYGETLEDLADSWEDSEPVELGEIDEQAGEELEEDEL